jgi:adenylate cyclase
VLVHQSTLWKVDDFAGDNGSLVVAEVERHSESQTFDKPVWLGAEVSPDARYFNSDLADHPFVRW